jgi:signal transduction histidine kinase
VRVRVPGDLPADVTDATQLRHHLCLAVRELVANVLKHASARELRLEIDATPDRILVTLADDGRGFDPGQPVAAGQDGLANVAGRLRELGGCLDLESTTGQGTRARLSVPLGSGAPATAFNGVPHAV